MARLSEPIRRHPLVPTAGRERRQPGGDRFVNRLTSQPNLGANDGDVDARHEAQGSQATRVVLADANGPRMIHDFAYRVFKP